jgi:hypothetical protein
METAIKDLLTPHICRNCAHFRPDSPFKESGDCVRGSSSEPTTKGASCVQFRHYLNTMKQPKTDLFQ